MERLRLALRYDNRLEYAIELARCHLRLGQLQRADEMLTHVLKTEPSNEKGLYYADGDQIRSGSFSAAHRLTQTKVPCAVSVKAGGNAYSP